MTPFNFWSFSATISKQNEARNYPRKRKMEHMWIPRLTRKIRIIQKQRQKKKMSASMKHESARKRKKNKKKLMKIEMA